MPHRCERPGRRAARTGGSITSRSLAAIGVAAAVAEPQTRADNDAVNAWCAALPAGLRPSTLQSCRQHAKR